MLLYSGYLIVLSYLILQCSLFASSSLPFCTSLCFNVQGNKSAIILTAEFLSMWNWDVGNFSSPGGIDSSNEETPTKMHSLACCWDHVFWQKLLGAAIEDLSGRNPECTPTSPYPCSPSLPPVDTCPLWHVDWLPHWQWSRGPWLMCCMCCLAESVWNRDDMLETLQIYFA